VQPIVEQGKLSLDEPVLPHLERWRFPGSGAHGDRVTIRHLLSHTAGLDDGLGYGGTPPGQPVQTLEESLSFPADSTVGEPRAATVGREPGTAMAYSGAGYTILQLLIEETTGRSFPDYMRESVLQPPGMTTASFDLEALEAEGRGHEVATSYDRGLRAQPPRRHAAKAAVSLYVTPRELARFVQAHTRENPVLAPETLKQMMTPQRGTAGTWGLGLTLFTSNGAGGHVVGHGRLAPSAVAIAVGTLAIVLALWVPWGMILGRSNQAA
jgi:CubicO group peptidase (beta-lactamase class C family)